MLLNFFSKLNKYSSLKRYRMGSGRSINQFGSGLEYDRVQARPTLPSINIYGDFNGGKIQMYFNIEKIGYGMYGCVYKCLNRLNNQVVAIKIMDTRDSNEVLSLECLRGVEGVLQMISWYYNNNCVYLVTEFIEGSTILDDVMFNIKMNKVFDVSRLKKILRNLRDTIIRCHKNYIAHRDIKMDNIMLLKDDSVKLIDFGLSEKFSEGDCFSVKSPGTFSYACPELLQGIEVDMVKADTWAFGVVMYSMMTNYFPFGKIDKLENRDRIHNMKVRYSKINDSEAVTILKGIFKLQDDRISIADLVGNPWFETGST